MFIQAIGASALILALSSEDLYARGIQPQELDSDHARALLQDACQSADIPLPQLFEIEAYPDEAGLLLFARLSPAPPEIRAFTCLSDLLDALSLLPELPRPARITYGDAHYQLILPHLPDGADAILSEFCVSEADAPETPGTLWMDDHALHALHRALGPSRTF
jgi:hypothetical protein